MLCFAALTAASSREDRHTLIARCVATGSNAQRYDYETETLIAVDWNNSAGGPNSEDTFMTLGSRREPAICGTIGAESVRHTNGFKSEADLLVAVDWRNSAGGPNSEDTFMTLGQRHPAVMFDPTALQPE